MTPKLALAARALATRTPSTTTTAVDPTGASNVAAQVGLNFNATEMTTFAASYAHEFRDSPVLGNYYDLDAADLGIGQRIGPVQLTAGGRYEYRRYKGFQMMAPIHRTDHVFQTRVQADLQFQRWFYVGASYTNLISRSEDTTAVAVADPGGGLRQTRDPRPPRHHLLAAHSFHDPRPTLPLRCARLDPRDAGLRS